SLTIRARFTPARPCSTFTRMCANFRFACFSAGVSFPPRGFFFRLACLLDRRLIALEARILVQLRPRRIADALLVRALLVVCLSGVGPAQEADPLAPGVQEDDVLIAVGFLL